MILQLGQASLPCHQCNCACTNHLCHHSNAATKCVCFFCTCMPPRAPDAQLFRCTHILAFKHHAAHCLYMYTSASPWHCSCAHCKHTSALETVCMKHLFVYAHTSECTFISTLQTRSSTQHTVLPSLCVFEYVHTCVQRENNLYYTLYKTMNHQRWHLAYLWWWDLSLRPPCQGILQGWALLVERTVCVAECQLLPGSLLAIFGLQYTRGWCDLFQGGDCPSVGQVVTLCTSQATGAWPWCFWVLAQYTSVIKYKLCGMESKS